MANIEVNSEVTGSVWQIKVKPGDRVESGDVLIIVESMKMEIPIITEESGSVREILITEGVSVSEGQCVVILEG